MPGVASSNLTELGRDECLRRPGGGTVRCIRGTKVASLMRASRAWFEVDDIDSDRRTGWSVIVTGVTEWVTHATEVRRLNTLGVDSWIAGRDAEWVRIRIRVVSGRRVSATRGRYGAKPVTMPDGAHPRRA